MDLAVKDDICCQTCNMLLLLVLAPTTLMLACFMFMRPESFDTFFENLLLLCLLVCM